MQIKLQRGFTLIEMLVVIAIISILIGIGVNTFTIAQKKARDVRRKADLRAVQLALELYRADKGGYPVATACGASPCAIHSKEASDWIGGGLQPNYIPKLPLDPLNTGSGVTYAAKGNYVYTYHISSDRITPTTTSNYSLMAQLENTEDPQVCGKQSPHYSGIGYGDWCDGDSDIATDTDRWLYVLNAPQ